MIMLKKYITKNNLGFLFYSNSVEDFIWKTLVKMKVLYGSMEN